MECSWEEGARKINESENLFARYVCELEELTLGLILLEAKVQAPILTARNDSFVERLTVGAKPIEEDGTCRVFELIFDRQHLISYTVLNESYGRYPELPEVFTGKLFRLFSWSHLLEFTRRTTHASDEYPGVLRHFQIARLNHVIDVITTAPPRIAVGMWPGENDPASPS